MSFDVHFWLDLETTGLEVGKEAILEMAWFFTDTNLKLLSPVRQRLTCIQPPQTETGGRRGPWMRSLDPQREDHWNDLELFDARNEQNPRVVIDMHTASGLKADHLAAPRDAIFTHPRDFERAYLDDLVDIEATADDTIGKIIMSGAGVSHFDNYMMDLVWPQQFPLLPPIDGSSRMAYWYLDVSTVTRLVPPSILERGREWAEDPEAPFSLLACESGPNMWSERGDLFKRGRRDIWTFDRSGVVPHRAAGDLVVSLLDARLIRGMEQYTGELGNDI